MRVAPGKPHVIQCHTVDREEAAGGAVFRRHVADRRAIGKREVVQPRAEELDELADDALAAEHLGYGEHEIGSGRAFRQLAA